MSASVESVRAAQRLLSAYPMEPTDVSVDEEPYNSVTGLARAVLRDLTQGTGDASRRVLAEVEAILSSSAPPAARNLLIVGFVEDVQNAA